MTEKATSADSTQLGAAQCATCLFPFQQEATGQTLEGQDSSPAAQWDRDSVRRAIDELFTLGRRYRTSAAYWELIEFVSRFQFYSPFNAMLTHVQMPGATYVAPAHRWVRDYGRRIRAGARPIVILQPMGPVMFVFDVSDTEAEKGAPPLPYEVLNPFEVRQGQVRGELIWCIENAKRDGVAVTERQAGSQSAGQIAITKPGRELAVLVNTRPALKYVSVPLRYELLLNAAHSPEAKFATLVHELGHLYCGHLGTPNSKWWPDRRGLSTDVCELEAESVCYLICTRMGIDNPSAEYVANFLKSRGESEIPPISLDCVMKSAGLIEQMGRGRLKPRKERQKASLLANL